MRLTTFLRALPWLTTMQISLVLGARSMKWWVVPSQQEFQPCWWCALKMTPTKLSLQMLDYTVSWTNLHYLLIGTHSMHHRPNCWWFSNHWPSCAGSELSGRTSFTGYSWTRFSEFNTDNVTNITRDEICYLAYRTLAWLLMSMHQQLSGQHTTFWLTLWMVQQTLL